MRVPIGCRDVPILRAKHTVDSIALSSARKTLRVYRNAHVAIHQHHCACAATSQPFLHKQRKCNSLVASPSQKDRLPTSSNSLIITWIGAAAAIAVAIDQHCTVTALLVFEIRFALAHISHISVRTVIVRGRKVCQHPVRGHKKLFPYSCAPTAARTSSHRCLPTRNGIRIHSRE